MKTLDIFFAIFNEQLIRYRRLDGICMREGLWHELTPKAKEDVKLAVRDNLETDNELRDRFLY